MLKKIKTLLNITDDSQNDLLNLLIALCSDEAMAYCNLNHSIPELETPILNVKNSVSDDVINVSFLLLA